jgi:hypothetical protein
VTLVLEFSWEAGRRAAILPPLEDRASVQIFVESSSAMQSKTRLRLSPVYSLIFLLQSESL